MVVLDFSECGKCNYTCTSILFQRNFKNWTSGNNDINKFIQHTQLSAHTYYEVKSALEWIPYDRLYDIKYIEEDDEFGKVYRANWIDGRLNKWNGKNQNWEREDQNMFVILKILNNPASISFEFIYKTAVPYKVYGITQDPETKNYMMVLNYKCKKCNKVCNSMHFQQTFIDWTSGNNDIDKFIQDTQLSDAHDDVKKALEWIPYDRLYDVKYITKNDEFGKVYRANWIDGRLNEWNDKNQNWEREDQNMFVILKNLNNPAIVTSKYIDKV
ncbi:hypothetical protein RirG_049770 [Rhizophagus irregularis DAOM 197198w]|uniref:Protein kinase domain-containing protein n=1 Tax=Rhizophagus irregularis (strain DAOM 197198w) TaxID=1432141 RepID=A0A015JYG1_RHIIW|nr:hypothetical protein RirG_049770 [Rhizophagus irregularis DAOM 197198w]